MPVIAARFACWFAQINPLARRRFSVLAGKEQIRTLVLSVTNPFLSISLSLSMLHSFLNSFLRMPRCPVKLSPSFRPPGPAFGSSMLVVPFRRALPDLVALSLMLTVLTAFEGYRTLCFTSVLSQKSPFSTSLCKSLTRPQTQNEAMQSAKIKDPYEY